MELSTRWNSFFEFHFHSSGHDSKFPPKQADDGSKPPPPAKDAPAPTHARRDDTPVGPKDPIKLLAQPLTSLPPPLPSNLAKDGKAPEFPPKHAEDGSTPPPPHAKECPAPTHVRRDDAPVKPKDPVKVPAQPLTSLPPPLPSNLPLKDGMAPEFLP